MCCKIEYERKEQLPRTKIVGHKSITSTNKIDAHNKNNNHALLNLITNTVTFILLLP